MQNEYIDKEKNVKTYFSGVRKELLDLIPINLRNGEILEIGAGSGDTLIYAKTNNYAKKIYGVELCNIDNSNQNNSLFEDFIIGNIEDMNLPYNEKKFNVILCGDVLEHLINPYDVIKYLKKFLTTDGVIIASLPNIRKLSILKTIFINGDFKYEDSGILDKTHLRFFTKKNMIELFENNNFLIEQIVNSELCSPIRYIKKGRLVSCVSCCFQYLFKEFFCIQYYIVASINKNK